MFFCLLTKRYFQIDYTSAPADMRSICNSCRFKMFFFHDFCKVLERFNSLKQLLLAVFADKLNVSL